MRTVNTKVTAQRMVVLLFVSLISSTFSTSAEPARWENELSGEGWKLWLDCEADWKTMQRARDALKGEDSD